MRKHAILLVDIGNTSVTIGIGVGQKVLYVSRIDSRKCSLKSIRATLNKVASGRLLAGAVLCSVVPGLNRLWIQEITRCLSTLPLVVNHRLDLGISLDYPKPATIGTDRLVNVCGAYAKYGAPVMVIDIGTATTFDIVTDKGTFSGGVIAPGPALMTEYMASRTALLPLISFSDAKCRTIGKSTVEAMQIGSHIGYRGLIREIVEYLIKNNNLGKVKIIATGGLARTALKDIDLSIRLDPALTLYGMNKIYSLNEEKNNRRQEWPVKHTR